MNFRRKKKPKQADERQVFDYACWLLARRNYSQKELLEKFESRFIPDEKIFEKVFAKLENLRLQSDANFTESFISAHKHWGARRIRIELKKRGVSEALIEMNVPDEVSEIKNAREVLVQKLKGKKIPEGYSEKQKLAAFLARRGFALDVIREVLGM